MTEDKMVGWRHRHEFEQAPGDVEGQASLVCFFQGVAKSRTLLSNFTFLSLSCMDVRFGL